jgi:tol-pal system protein YbgF
MRLAPIAASAAAVLACVWGLPANGGASKKERIEILEDRMSEVERRIAGQGLFEMARQLEALNAENRRLRGELESLQHELDAARGQQRDQYVDLDARLRAAEAALAAGPAASVASGGPEAEYQAAFDHLKEGRYDEATAALQQFVNRHRDHELASNAQYWLGEAHYVKREYPAALAAFEGVLSGYPGARKAPDALLKIGYCQYELKRYDLARAALARLNKEFPESPAAIEGTQRLERMGAEGR